MHAGTQMSITIVLYLDIWTATMHSFYHDNTVIQGHECDGSSANITRMAKDTTAVEGVLAITVWHLLHACVQVVVTSHLRFLLLKGLC